MKGRLHFRHLRVKCSSGTAADPNLLSSLVDHLWKNERLWSISEEEAWVRSCSCPVTHLKGRRLAQVAPLQECLLLSSLL